MFISLITPAQAQIVGPFKPSWYKNGTIQWASLTKFLTETLLFIATLACLLFLIWGGINMISSGGDKTKFETGRNRIVFAIIGLIVVASAFVIWQFVLDWLGITDLELPTK